MSYCLITGHGERGAGLQFLAALGSSPGLEADAMLGAEGKVTYGDVTHAYATVLETLDSEEVPEALLDMETAAKLVLIILIYFCCNVHPFFSVYLLVERDRGDRETCNPSMSCFKTP